MSSEIDTRRQLFKQAEAKKEVSRLEQEEALITTAEDRPLEEQHVVQEKLLGKLFKGLQRNYFIPIIGDTVRNEKIFDIDYNKLLSKMPEWTTRALEELDTEAGEAGQTAQPEKTEENLGKRLLPERELSITEQLAVFWASEMKYPLVDRYRMARVAQYAQYRADNTEPVDAKEAYLLFQMKQLLNEARETGVKEKNEREIKRAEYILRFVEHLTFSDIVTELGLPRIKPGEEDPLEFLAQLPIRYYVTTGYYDFVEKALKKYGKKPVTRFCVWNMETSTLHKHHRPVADWEPNEDEPMVYHLFGLAEYPESILLSEDDYVEFLMSLSKSSAKDSAETFIAAYIEAALRSSELLLLGYRLHDWDFRVLFRVIKVIFDRGPRQRSGVALQLDPGNQLEIAYEKAAVENATKYLMRYFRRVDLTVNWDRTDKFIKSLWEYWKERDGGG